MSTWRMYLFSLMAVCYIGGCIAFPIGTEETQTPPPVLFNFANEKHLGRYTGPWEGNTLTSFERVRAVIEYNYQTRVERLVAFWDELTDVEKQAVIDKPFDMATLTIRSVQYARDYRQKTTHQNLGDNRYYYMEIEDTSNAGEEPTYPLNKEFIWQIDIPENHLAFVALTSIALEKPQDGSCINDFVSVYTDNGTPDKFCSTLEQIRQFKTEGAQRLTVKFQSNEVNNSGGFAGAVWILHNSTVLSQKRSRRDTSLSVAEDPIHIAMEERNEELIKGDDMDLPEVEEAVTCLVHIAKYGERAAAQYLNSHNTNCKEMAVAFIERKYT